MKTALITGASRGIGRALALELARRGFNVLLTARSAEQLERVAAEVRQLGREARVLPLDLAGPSAAGLLATWVLGQTSELTVLVNNAGYGLWGRFEELGIEQQLNMLQLNMQLPVTLTHILLPMLQRQPGAYILNVASTAAYQAVPTLTLYAASKAFMLSFSRGLRYELRDTLTSVSCLSPGATTTEFALRAGMNAELQATSNKVAMTPEQVAQAGIAGLLAGEAEIIPGALNKVSTALTSLVPKGLTERIAAGIYQRHLQ
ncbi:SDR family NAD(P)-dependent oxidoreductase [Hymenobacter metallilatus]|uniref:SDR family oxidoreductase n=1 Tax=Hymenobacter metallilatus TaxID=2493666 RepID=A0A3R9N2I1_9BACT|nr:SDR family oxidoreductase [Hymenobacter metallilatus]RSK37417.1 SDR family oxidoreductase [Hymenobacter metallilatus]